MKPAVSKAIGIDIGGTKIHSALIDDSGTIVKEDIRPTPARDGSDAVLKAAVESALSVVHEDIRVVGVGIPGTVDNERGLALRAANLAGWENVPVAKELKRHLHAPVHILNDVRAGAYAEWLWGFPETDGGNAAVRPSPFLYVNIGTGVAAALIVDGRLYEGASNSAGEFGHSILDPRADATCPGCGNRGDVEALIAGPGLTRAYERALQKLDPKRASEESGGDARASTVLKLGLAGEQPAAAVLDEYITYCGLALANLITLYNPRRIVLGGGLGTAPTLPLNRIRAEAKKYAYATSWDAVTIGQARLGSASGAIGAAGWAASQVERTD